MNAVRAIYGEFNLCFVCTLGEVKSLRILCAWLSAFLPPHHPGGEQPWVTCGQAGSSRCLQSAGPPAFAWKPGLFEVSSGVTRKHRQEKEGQPSLDGARPRCTGTFVAVSTLEVPSPFWESQQCGPSQEAGLWLWGLPAEILEPTRCRASGAAHLQGTCRLCGL